MEQETASIHPFKKIWLHPRTVFASLKKDSYNKYTVLLLMLGGIARSFDGAMADDRGDQFSLFEICAAAIIGGVIFGWIFYYLYGLLLQWTGKWLGGTGSKKQLINMLAYAMIPVAFGLLLLLVRILIFGNEIFKSDGNLYDVSLFWRTVDRGALFGQWLLGIYALVLLIIGISEVQHISIQKALLNFILPMLVVFIPLAFLVWLLIAPSL